MTEKILCYLSPQAELAMGEMSRLGFDVDLALAFMERLCSEDEIYELPTD